MRPLQARAAFGSPSVWAIDGSPTQRQERAQPLEQVQLRRRDPLLQLALFVSGDRAGVVVAPTRGDLKAGTSLVIRIQTRIRSVSQQGVIRFCAGQGRPLPDHGGMPGVGRKPGGNLVPELSGDLPARGTRLVWELAYYFVLCPRDEAPSKESPMIQVDVSIHLNRPVDQVFAFLTDPSKLPTWQSNLIAIEQLTEGPMRVGTRIREVRRLGRRPTEHQVEVVVFEPNERLALQVMTGPHVMVSYSFEAEDGGTRLRYQFVMRTNGMMRLLEPLIVRSLRKQSTSDFETLKGILER